MHKSGLNLSSFGTSAHSFLAISALCTATEKGSAYRAVSFMLEAAGIGC